MRLVLPAPIVAILLDLPETGMGHQRVDLILRDGRTIPGVTVLNAEIAELPAGVGPISPDDVLSVRLGAIGLENVERANVAPGHVGTDGGTDRAR